MYNQSELLFHELLLIDNTRKFFSIGASKYYRHTLVDLILYKQVRPVPPHFQFTNLAPDKEEGRLPCHLWEVHWDLSLRVTSDRVPPVRASSSPPRQFHAAEAE